MCTTEKFNHLVPEQQLNVALEAVKAFSGWVMNVDTKLGTLSTAQVVLALFMAAQPLSRTWPADSPLSKIALASVIIFTISFLATVRHLGGALYPRVSTGSKLNHFVFPSVARANVGALGDEPTDCLIRQAWAQAHALSVIAVARYRHFSRALIWSGVSVLSVVVWLIVAGQIP